MRTNASRGFATELLKDMMFPELCPICKDAVPFAKRAALHLAVYTGAASFEENKELYYGGTVCRGCLRSLSFITEPCCVKCGKQLKYAGSADLPAETALKVRGNDAAGLDYERTDANGRDRIKINKRNIHEETNEWEGGVLLCTDCRNTPRSFIQSRSVLRYDETARELMADIKYNSKREYLELPAVLAADRLGDWVRHTGARYLVPVPVHESRLISRGYNQSEVLAELIGGYLGIPVLKNVLRRRVRTEAQKELDAGDRLLNLQTAFEPAMRLPDGIKVIIVDDIYTTGATLEACSECLIEAGAEEVYGLCICAGDDEV